MITFDGPGVTFAWSGFLFSLTVSGIVVKRRGRLWTRHW